MERINERAQEILALLYLPEAIYLKEVMDYSTEQKSITGKFSVPRGHSYTFRPIEYVTAEQYIRCLSQLSYILIGFLIQDKVSDFNFTDFKRFKRLMVECKIWFRRSIIHYLRNTPKDSLFELKLTLEKVKIVQVFSICTLKISGVVYGKLEFVAPFTNDY
jgi:hypothetical protein